MGVRILTGLVASGLFATILSCSQPRPPHVLRIQLSAEPISLDPAFAEDGVSMQVLKNTMDGLVGYDGSGALVNRLAESYSISPNRKRYEFKLRSDAKWSDGKSVQAEDFVAAFRRALAPSTPSKLSSLLMGIRGAEAYHSGKKGPESLSVRGEAGKLIIELDHPVSYFLQALTLTSAFPIRADLIASNEGKWSESFPVTGSYRIVRHEIERKIVLEKNPFAIASLQSPSAPAVIELVNVADESTGTHLFEQGKLDILTKVPATEIGRYRKNGWLRTDPYLAVYYLAFNIRKPPFDDVVVRRTVAASIHKEEITTALESGEKPAWSFIPAGLEGAFAEPIPGLSPRPSAELEHARKKLAATSSSGTKGKSRSSRIVTASFDSSSRNSMILEKVQNDLEKNIGLHLSLTNMDWKSYVRSLQTDAAPLYRFGWLAPFGDPITHLEVFATGNPNNYSHWSNVRYDKLVGEISRLAPSPARDQKMKEAQYLLERDEAVVIPIFHYVQNHAVSSRVEGFRVNPYGVIRFDELKLKEK
jgi:oligopeptide transport system substrate-binding protein